jgi:hypothetical protein
MPASKLKIAVVVLPVVLGMACNFKLPKKRPPTAEEKLLLPTAEHVLPLLEFAEEEGSGEGKFTFDYSFGTHELDYEYESEGLFLTTGISVDKSESAAESTYKTIALGMSIGLRTEDVVREPCVPAMTIGDKSKCQRLVTDGLALGSIVFVRDGRRVLYMLLAAEELSTETLTTLLTPFVEKMANYNPSQ